MDGITITVGTIGMAIITLLGDTTTIIHIIEECIHVDTII
jgi:hypothetical protein